MNHEKLIENLRAIRNEIAEPWRDQWQTAMLDESIEIAEEARKEYASLVAENEELRRSVKEKRKPRRPTKESWRKKRSDARRPDKGSDG